MINEQIKVYFRILKAHNTHTHTHYNFVKEEQAY